MFTRVFLSFTSYVLQLIVNDGVVNSAADTVTVTSNSTSTSTSTSSSGGGGCTMMNTETADPLLPALLLLALTGLAARNTRTLKHFGML